MIYVTGPGHGGPALVAQAYLEGTYSEVYSEHRSGRGRHEAAVQAVQLPRRHSQPRRARDAGLDPRGRRARLRALARLRRRLRQSRSHRRLRRRRRRSRDRPAGDRLALQQVPQSGARRRRAADPASQRLQDRQSVLPRAHSARGAAEALRGLRLSAVFRRRATIRRWCISRWRRRSTVRRRDQAHPAPARARRVQPAARRGR